MEKIRQLFTADESYRKNMQSFTLRDTAIAVVYYTGLMALYYIIGHLYAVTKIRLSIPMNIILMLIPVFICRRALSRTGISKNKLKPSLIMGCVIGGIFLLSYTVIPCIIAHRQLLPAANIAYNIFFFFLIIGLSEEISFRGFIQPRLFPLCKHEWLTVLVGGVLFVFMHFPFQMAARQMTFAEYWPLFLENAPMQMILHFVFTWLCRRYGNIFGSTVMHGLVDMTGGIFC